MAQIQLRNISKRWGSFVGVDDFDLTIADKEFLVLLGPSGCGKTTTMRMIAGLEDPTEGEIRIGDRVVNNLDPKDRDVAMVFQSYGLYPNLNVYENIRFPLKVRKVDAATHDARVRKAAEMVELTDFLHRKPAELSGGQRQRVALARAIVREPNVFLMDEPLSNLDAKLRVSTRAQIKNLSHELKVTTVYVTHDQIEAMTLADRVVVMQRGVVQQVGTPTEIYDNPANTFVAGFIGSPAMNLMQGEILWRHLPRQERRDLGPRGRGRTGDPGISSGGCVGRRLPGGNRRADLYAGAAGRRHHADRPRGRRARLGQGTQGFPRRDRGSGVVLGAGRHLPPLRSRDRQATAPFVMRQRQEASGAQQGDK